MNRVLLLLIALTCSCSSLLPDRDQREPLEDWINLEPSDRRWYSRILVALDEGNLSVVENEFVYRFLLLRTFDKPISVRIMCSNECHLRAVRSSGKSGYDPGQIEDEVSRSLSTIEKQNFLNLILEAEFWDGQPELEHWGLDGARWILEGKTMRNYQVWDVWSPLNIKQYQGYVSLCKYMLQLANFDLDGKIY